ncbi:HD domain-containing protein [Candidatus Omnitrophota bacterium]
MISNCPGAQRFRQPEPEAMKCPHCGRELEIWTDEPKTECPACKNTVTRKDGQSCLDWCRYAKDCVGADIFGKYMKNRSVTIRQKLLEGLEEYFGDDKKRIDHAKRVMDVAEELLKRLRGDWHIVIPASILHDAGIKAAEAKYGSVSNEQQEIEGAEIAKKFLLKIGLRKGDIEEICDIIAHHHTPGAIDTVNFRILYDADSIVNLKERMAGKEPEEVMSAIEKQLLTKAGKEAAEDLYLK